MSAEGTPTRSPAEPDTRPRPELLPRVGIAALDVFDIALPPRRDLRWRGLHETLGSGRSSA